MNTGNTENTEREAIQQQLDEELQLIHFEGHERVLKMTHPPTFGARLFAFWNKEIEIPVKPIGAIGAIILVVSLTLHQPEVKYPPQQNVQQHQTRELIEAGGNTYWKDIYDQAVKRHEN
jgi:sporulation protein YlmC with PRC-barrel domain